VKIEIVRGGKPSLHSIAKSSSVDDLAPGARRLRVSAAAIRLRSSGV
jgi:hypothetical protein